MTSVERSMRSLRRMGSLSAVRRTQKWRRGGRAVAPALMATAVGVGAILLAAAAGAGQLPPEVQADAYLLEVEQAIGDGNYDRAWDRLQDIVSLQADNDLELPEFPFWYAKAAAATNMPGEALASVTEYLTAAGREAAHYSEALALLNALQARALTEGVQAPAARRAYLTLNLSWLAAKRAFIQNSSMGLYGETANFDTLYSSSADLLPGAFLGVRAWKDLSVAMGVTRFRTATDVNLRGTVPHPLFFGQAREVEQQLAGFEHQQVGIHLQMVWMDRINERVDVAVSAGPSMFLVTQDRATEIAGGYEAFPYDAVMVTAGKEAVRTRAFGANVGIDLTVNVARHLGLGIFVRWTGGRADFPELGPEEIIKAGGVDGGLGLHLRF